MEVCMRVVSLAVALVFAALCAPVAAQDKADKPAKKEAAAPAATVNLNTASAAQIESLPGVGPKVAERIIEYRQKNGGFKKIEELMNVKGIGEKSFLKLKPYITVAAPEKSGTKQQ
jgi:competence protein ComEA